MNKIIKVKQPKIFLKTFNNYLISDIKSLKINNKDLNIIKHSFSKLKIDNYHNSNNPPTRLRKFFDVDVDMSNKKYIKIIFNNDKSIFKQPVEDDRGKPREFDLIDDNILYSKFMISFISKISGIVKSIEDVNKLNICIHQVRQMCYPGIISENSPEGVHQDGADYIVSALVINRINLKGGISDIYDMDKNLLKFVILNENELIFQNDKKLYHYVTPIECSNKDYLGFRDIRGLDINIMD